MYYENAKEVFTLTLDPMKDDNSYILDLTERISASLNLYCYLVSKEKNYIKLGIFKEPILTESKYKDETIRKKYFESLAHTIQAGLSGIEEDSQTALQNAKDDSIKDGILNNVNGKRNSLNML